MKRSIDLFFNNDEQQRLIDFCSNIHQNPELSGQEINTTDAIVNMLNSLGVQQINRLDPTGVVAVIPGAEEHSQKVAIRGDIDALPIQETTGLSYQSHIPNVMHACGHDIHTSWVMASVMLLIKQPAPGPVVCIFQPSEEISQGAKQVLSQFDFSDIKAIIGGHVDRRYNVGEVVVHNGPISASSDYFTLTIHGMGTHGARPLDGHSPFPLAGEIIQKIEMFAAQKRPSAILSICQVNAGSSANIIPDDVVIKGTIRTQHPDDRQCLIDFLKGLESNESSVSVHCHLDQGSPAIINHSELVTWAESAVETTLGRDQLVPLAQPNMASEDFGFYVEQIPGVFLRLGVKQPSEPFIPVHNSNFVADQESLFYGGAVLAEWARVASDNVNKGLLS